MVSMMRQTNTNNDDTATSGVNNTYNDNKCFIGPDINHTRSKLDPKLYRQILLPNGLRCVLIQDTLSMQQQQQQSKSQYDDDDESASSIDECDEKIKDNTTIKETKPRIRRRPNRHLDDDNDDNLASEEDMNFNDDDDDDDDEVDDNDNNNIRDAAAAMIVGVGSCYDPDECQGLAHYVEHLLFMGSTKYPIENEYESYITQHGGSDNAYTEWEYTLYHFNIPQDYVWGALDRFANIFIAPLFQESSVQRELNSIESEFHLNQRSDANRYDQILCTSSFMHHPFCTFSWGNIKSLHEIPTSRMNGSNTSSFDPIRSCKDFYHTHYYASNMRLVIMAAYPLDIIQTKVIEMFSDIPSIPHKNIIDINNKNPPSERSVYLMKLWEKENERYGKNSKIDSIDVSWENSSIPSTPLQYADVPFQKNRGLCELYCIVPIKEKHSISITWQLPSILPYWKSRPTDYISHLLGHEGVGSILSYLRSHNIANSCTVGVGDTGIEKSSCHALFVATFTLSEYGITKWPLVVETIYQYISMLREYFHCDDNDNNDNTNTRDVYKKELPSYIYEELQMIQNMSYQYEDELSPDDLVEGLAEHMAHHIHIPPEHLLDGSTLLFEYNHNLIRDIIHQYLIPSNSRIDIFSSKFGKVQDYENQQEQHQSPQQAADSHDDATMESYEPSSFPTIIHDMIKIKDPLLDDGMVDPNASSPPMIEPMFGTPFWCYEIPSLLLDKWSSLLSSVNTNNKLHLPIQNPFVPTNLDLKSVDDHNDASHPLLGASIKVCITIGRKKQWLPATIIRYNSKKNHILLSFEDQDEKWYPLDTPLHELEELIKNPNGNHSIQSFVGTMDTKRIKYRIIALSLIPGQGIVRKFGDESDDFVEDGLHYPPIPPANPYHIPQEICSTDTLKMWWLYDRYYHRPIADYRIQMVCGTANQTPIHRACADLYCMICCDALIETTYLAEMCELNMSFQSTEIGFYIRLHGFDNKLLQLFEMVMQLAFSFRTAAINELPSTIQYDRYEACLEVLKRKYKNTSMTSSSLAADLRLQALRPTLWSSNQLLKGIESIDVTIFTQTICSILQDFAMECFYHGNVTKDDAIYAKDLMIRLIAESNSNQQDITSLSRNKYPSQSIVQIPPSIQPHIIQVPSKDTNEPNTSCEVYYQIGKDNIRDRTYMDLLIQLMQEPFFDQIRTKDQYGYSVYCSERWSYGIIGCTFHITTSVKTCHDVMERIHQFLMEFRHELYNMKKETFLEHQIALAKEKLDMFNSMSELTDTLWCEIRDGRFQWEIWRDEAIYLRTIQLQDIINIYDEWFLPGKKEHSILAVQVIGRGCTANNKGFGQNDTSTTRDANNDSRSTKIMNENEIFSSNGDNTSFQVEDYYDAQIHNFHNVVCKKQTFGRVNAKLF